MRLKIEQFDTNLIIPIREVTIGESRIDGVDVTLPDFFGVFRSCFIEWASEAESILDSSLGSSLDSATSSADMITELQSESYDKLVMYTQRKIMYRTTALWVSVRAMLTPLSRVPLSHASSIRRSRGAPDLGKASCVAIIAER